MPGAMTGTVEGRQALDGIIRGLRSRHHEVALVAVDEQHRPVQQRQRVGLGGLHA